MNTGAQRAPDVLGSALQQYSCSTPLATRGVMRKARMNATSGAASSHFLFTRALILKGGSQGWGSSDCDRLNCNWMFKSRLRVWDMESIATEECDSIYFSSNLNLSSKVISRKPLLLQTNLGKLTWCGMNALMIHIPMLRVARKRNVRDLLPLFWCHDLVLNRSWFNWFSRRGVIIPAQRQSFNTNDCRRWESFKSFTSLRFITTTVRIG